MAKKEVFSYLENHNRPFSINEIQQGVKGDFGKTAIQKALDSLVEEEKVKEKIYGKQKVYCIMQRNESSAADMRENLLEIDRQINETTIKLKDVSGKLKSDTAEMSAIKGKMTLEEALNQKLQLETELEEVKNQLKKYSDTQTVCPKVKSTADKDYEKISNDYKKRKRICMDILNSILENYPKTKKHLYEEIGIETDEEAGFSIDKL